MRLVGILAVLGAAAIWAFEPILARTIGADTGFDQMLFSRALGCVVMSGVFFSTRILFSQKKSFVNGLTLSFPQWRAFFLIGFLGSFFADLLYFIAILFFHTPVVNAVLIAHLQPVFLVLFGHFIFHEGKFSFWDYGGIVAMLFSALLVISGSLDNLLGLRFGGVGDFLVLGATVFWALSGLLAKKYLQNQPSSLITMGRFLVSLPFYGLLALLVSQHLFLSFQSLLFGALIGVGYFFYYEGLKRLKTAQAAALELAAPVFATGLGFVFFHETVSLFKWIGIGLLFVGIFCFERASRDSGETVA
ncbi:DMT family transporter [Thermospira aquatica]|uniref:DMT family transporter n=1 Tax=Thermospira aquatica TaxID=2828656 RepID=A0AAX3BFL3_9SPIR|nr:DMT family transporter [Thermospira aquatica]URA10986.1 DMT family transporter [Thermospira aquatica]